MASDQEALSTLLAVADSAISEAELAVWFRADLHPLSES